MKNTKPNKNSQSYILDSKYLRWVQIPDYEL